MDSRDQVVERIPDDDRVPYDYLVSACGYEGRATTVAKMLETRVAKHIVHEYANESQFSYDKNKLFFKYLSADFVDLFGFDWSSRLALTDSGPGVRVAVDISCMDRDLIAWLVAELSQFESREVLSVDYYYTPGKYTPGLFGSAGTITVNRPARGLEGWATYPDRPLACVVGLGYEGELALAAVESLEPSGLYAYSPRGVDEQYDVVVEANNADFLRSMSEPCVFYNIKEPLTLYRSLHSLARTLSLECRLVLVPLGPKIFALASALVASTYAEHVSMWRVSSGEDRVPEERVEAGAPLGLRVTVRFVETQESYQEF